MKVIEVKRSIFENNDKDAASLREQLKGEKTFLLNLMSSPGSGKTSTLVPTVNELLKDYRVGVMEADIDSDVDAWTIADRTKAKVVQLHTGGMCHLDADMTRQGLKELGTEDVDIAILENVGNLVCPEGHDKPLKYPLIFTVCDALIINKIDVLPYFDFDMDKVKEDAWKRNPNLKIFPISAKTGEGMEAWYSWLKEEADKWMK